MSWLATLVATVAASSSALASTQSTVPADVDLVNGGFHTEVAFTLPAFHGLEPALGLAYSSSAHNGFAGAGWALTGVSRIVAHHPNGGVPQFDGADEYVLDGNVLHPCTGARCLGTGGTHVAEHHRFQRIVRDLVGDKWLVTSANGTVSEYWRTVAVVAGTATWELRRVRDTNGNAVVFTYALDNRTAYLDTISYSDVVVTLVREARPDVVVAQVGGTSLGQMLARLQAVKVTVGGLPRALWKLSYGLTSPSSGQSRLDSVQACGTDATVSPAGVVTGTCLPPETFTYAGTGASVGFSVINSSHTLSYSGYGAAQVGDFDGNGRSDLVWTKVSSTGFSARATLWNGSGFDPPTTTFTLAGDFTGYTASVADLNADGRSDLVVSRFDATGWSLRTALADGKGGFTAGASALPLAACPGCPTDYRGYQLAAADADGDGATDLFAWRATSSAARVVMVRSLAGAPFALAAPVLRTEALGNFSGQQLLLGDFRALGRESGTQWLPGPAATGPLCDTFSSFPTSNSIVRTTQHAADLDADGSDELVTVAHATTCTSWPDPYLTLPPPIPYYIPLPTRFDVTEGPTMVGSRSVAGVDPTNVPYWQSFTDTLSGASDLGAQIVAFADFDGDGRADLFTAVQDASSFGVAVALSRGTSFAPLVSAYGGASLGSDAALLVGDFNGDGRSDLVSAANKGTSVSARVLVSTTWPVGRLVSLTTPTGATTTVSYQSSSAFTNSSLPVGFAVPVVQKLSVDDGRGHVTVNTYDYGGGLWSNEERRFLGFARVTRTDGSGTQTETLYRQTRASAGAPEVVTVSDAQGRTYTQTQRTYLEKNDAWPYYSLLESEAQSTCNLTSTCKTAQSQTTWNVTYGVPTRTDNFGDLGVTGDETTTLITYATNDASFIGNLPSSRKTLSGSGAPGAVQLQKTTYSYDAAGNLTMTQAWHDGPGYLNAVTTQTFDTFGNVVSLTDPRGGTSTTTYDSSGRFVVGQCNAVGHCTSQVWHPVLGAVTSQTDANGRTTRFTFDALGRPVRTIWPQGGWSLTQYFNVGDAAAQYTQTTLSDDTADGLWTRAFTDGLGRVYQERKEGGATRLTEYALNRPELVTRKSAWFAPSETPLYEAFTFDGLGRVTRQTHADGSFSTTAYGIASGQLLTLKTDELGQQTAVWSDALGHQTRYLELLAGAWRRTVTVYDALGRVTLVQDAANNVTTNAYDSLGRRVSACNPDRGCTASSYDASGNLTSQTDAKGQVLAVTYDALNRPLTKTGGYSWAYDAPGHLCAKGHLTRHTFPSGSDDFSYDFAGRIVSTSMVRDGQTLVVSTTFDTTGQGRPVATTIGAETVTQTYDDTGHVDSVPGYAPHLAYDVQGRLSSLSLVNGLVESYAFDAASGRLTTHTVKDGAAVLFRGTYGYDAKGKVTSLATSTNGVGSTLTMGYDELDRLTAVSGSQTQTLAYDVLGNITFNSLVGDYVYGDATHVHGVTRAGSGSYTYDANGNMLTGGGRALSWTLDDRLARVTDASGTASTFEYDGNGRRVKQVSGATTSYYFGDAVEQEGSTLWRYVSVNGHRLARRDVATGAKVFFHQDGLGSTRLMTGGAGAVLRTYDYRPFGAVKATTGTAANTSLRYASSREDSSGLLYLGARYYEPALGRFISADTVVPAGSPQQLNRYSYANNSPYTFTDPSGHAASLWQGIVDFFTGGSSSHSPVPTAYAGSGNLCTGSDIYGLKSASSAGPMMRAITPGDVYATNRAAALAAAQQTLADTDYATRPGPELGLVASGIMAESMLGALAGRMAIARYERTLSGINPTASATNCFNCMIATENTLRGSATVAMPGYGAGARAAWVDTVRSFAAPGAAPIRVGEAGLNELVAGLPSGSRGFVMGGWEGSASGHAFNAINVGGKAMFYDGQVGAFIDTAGMDRFVFVQTK